MKKLNFVLSLITQDNDYQIEQAASAEEIARRLGLDLKIVFADNDAIQQSQQILEFIQTKSAALPDGIILEPARRYRVAPGSSRRGDCRHRLGRSQPPRRLPP